MRRPKPSGKHEGRAPAPHFSTSAYYRQLELAQARGVRFSRETRKTIELYLSLRRAERLRQRAEEAIERGIRRRSFKLHVMKSLGYLCSCCGESLTVAQTIDHVHGGGCLERKEKKDSWGRAGEDSEGLQLLCVLCNTMKADRALCPHQEIARNIFMGGPVLVTHQGQVMAA